MDCSFVAAACLFLVCRCVWRSEDSFAEVGFALLPCGSQGLNLDPQASQECLCLLGHLAVPWCSFGIKEKLQELDYCLSVTDMFTLSVLYFCNLFLCKHYGFFFSCVTGAFIHDHVPYFFSRFPNRKIPYTIVQ